MASNYPDSLDSFDTIASDKKTSDAVGGRTHRGMHNDLGDAIEAVQAELGTDPAGASATVKARFEVIEANDWVTSARIADSAVTSGAIADGAVTTDKIAAAAVTAEKLGVDVGAATLEVGTIATGDADVSISGNVEDGYTLDFVLPSVGDGDVGFDAFDVEVETVVRPGWRFNGFHVTAPELCSLTTIPALKDSPGWRGFRAPADMPVTGMSMACGDLAASGLTHAQMALWHIGDAVSGAGKRMSFTMIARTADDTSLFGSTNTAYTKTWDTTDGWPSVVRLRAGEWYAVGYLLQGTTAPQLIGMAVPRPQVMIDQLGGSAGGLSAWLTDTAPFWTGNSLGYDRSGLTAWYRLSVDEDNTVAPMRRTVLLGDSFFASYAGFFSIANGQSGSTCLPVFNAGVGGQTLAQMLTRVDAHVAAYAPEVVVLHGGCNDLIAQSQTAATTISRYEAILAALLAIPSVEDVIVCVPPSDTTASAGQKAELATVRTWLTTTLSMTGVTVADTGMAMTTGDGVTADASKIVDTIHPLPTGQQAMADVLDDVLAAL